MSTHAQAFVADLVPLLVGVQHFLSPAVSDARSQRFRFLEPVTPYEGPELCACIHLSLGVNLEIGMLRPGLDVFDELELTGGLVEVFRVHFETCRDLTTTMCQRGLKEACAWAGVVQACHAAAKLAALRPVHRLVMPDHTFSLGDAVLFLECQTVRAYAMCALQDARHGWVHLAQQLQVESPDQPERAVGVGLVGVGGLARIMGDVAARMTDPPDHARTLGPARVWNKGPWQHVAQQAALDAVRALIHATRVAVEWSSTLPSKGTDTDHVAAAVARTSAAAVHAAKLVHGWWDRVQKRKGSLFTSAAVVEDMEVLLPVMLKACMQRAWTRFLWDPHAWNPYVFSRDGAGNVCVAIRKPLKSRDDDDDGDVDLWDSDDWMNASSIHWSSATLKCMRLASLLHKLDSGAACGQYEVEFEPGAAAFALVAYLRSVDRAKESLLHVFLDCVISCHRWTTRDNPVVDAALQYSGGYGVLWSLGGDRQCWRGQENQVCLWRRQLRRVCARHLVGGVGSEVLDLFGMAFDMVMTTGPDPVVLRRFGFLQEGSLQKAFRRLNATVTAMDRRWTAVRAMWIAAAVRGALTLQAQPRASKTRRVFV